MALSLTMNSSIQTPRRPGTHSSSNVMGFMKELDRLQEQQLLYTKKLESERRRRLMLDEKIEMARKEILALQADTKGGQVLKDETMLHRKNVARLEHSLQMVRKKLSVAHTENIEDQRQINNMRQDKVLNLQIKHDLERELDEVRKRTQEAHREVALVNEKKHTAKKESAAIKQQMVSDMEEFARELDLAKKAISSTQEVIIGSIRERMNTSMSHWTITDNSVHHYHKRSLKSANEEEKAQSEVSRLLQTTGMKSIEELISHLQQSEEYIFSMYKNIQSLNEELEKLDLDNKRLETMVDAQVSELGVIEGNNDRVRQDLEQHIKSIQKTISKHEQNYNTNLAVLHSLSEPLLNIMKNVASDDDAADQQLLSSGITDRNVARYLGIVEERIDDLIQMSKAAQKEPIVGREFVHMTSTGIEKQAVNVQPSTLPSLQEGPDDGDDDTDDNARVQPININVLKDFMQKKLQKGMTSGRNQAFIMR